MRPKLLSILIAAKARALAEDIRKGRTWPGDVARGVSEIIETAHKASNAASTDR